MELDENIIHLWMMDFARITDDILPARYLALLTPDEKDRQVRFHFVVDRLRYLSTRALVRTVLSRYVPIAPEAWRFETNRYGRPSLLNPTGRAAQLTFNISHSSTLILLGVASGFALGVDVENRRVRPAPLDVVDRYFARWEARELRAIPTALQSDRFFDLWTLKESYIKARGIGLSLPLERFGFALQTNARIAFWVDDDLSDEAARWHFWQLYPADDYVAAICAEKISKKAPQLLAKRIVPMLEETPFEPIRWLRSTI